MVHENTAACHWYPKALNLGGSVENNLQNQQQKHKQVTDSWGNIFVFERP